MSASPGVTGCSSTGDAGRQFVYSGDPTRRVGYWSCRKARRHKPGPAWCAGRDRAGRLHAPLVAERGIEVNLSSRGRDRGKVAEVWSMRSSRTDGLDAARPRPSHRVRSVRVGPAADANRRLNVARKREDRADRPSSPARSAPRRRWDSDERPARQAEGSDRPRACDHRRPCRRSTTPIGSQSRASSPSHGARPDPCPKSRSSRHIEYPQQNLRLAPSLRLVQATRSTSLPCWSAAAARRAPAATQ